jgi:hypothetical protein
MKAFGFDGLNGRNDCVPSARLRKAKKADFVPGESAESSFAACYA